MSCISRFTLSVGEVVRRCKSSFYPQRPLQTYIGGMSSTLYQVICLLDEPLQRLKRLLAPGVSRRHRWRLPAPVSLHRLQRRSPARHPDREAHAARMTRVSLTQVPRLSPCCPRADLSETLIARIRESSSAPGPGVLSQLLQGRQCVRRDHDVGAPSPA